MGKTLHDAKSVRELVERIAADHEPDGFRFVVGEPARADRPQFKGWSVPMDADREDVNAVDFANRLVELEDMVREQLGDDVELFPDASYL
jgi:hypothetical protein